MNEHLSDLALELSRTGEAEPEETAHLASCPICAERLRLFNALASDFGMIDEPVAVPADRDAAIMAMIGSQAERIQETLSAPTSIQRRRFAAGAGMFAAVAVAATVALLLVSPGMLDRSASDAEPAISAGTDDINRDGRIDILDAFALSRQLKQNADTSSRNQADVDRIAALAVSLDRSHR